MSGTGRLAENVVHFARVLRAAGIPIGTDKVIDAVRALPLPGLDTASDWHATLAALFLTRHEQQALFDEAFERFWRDPALEEKMRALLLPQGARAARRATSPRGRLAEALSPPAARKPPTRAAAGSRPSMRRSRSRRASAARNGLRDA